MGDLRLVFDFQISNKNIKQYLIVKEWVIANVTER